MNPFSANPWRRENPKTCLAAKKSMPKSPFFSHCRCLCHTLFQTHSEVQESNSNKNFIHSTTGDTMNKSEMIDAIAARTELSKAASAKALDAVLETIVETVTQGEAVTLVGFGSFKASERASREGKNPKTGAKILIPQTVVPKFAAGATFKARVAGKDE
ncbi:MAG: HU family DNA-binding protein [Candidatus Accumulibacter propinquus]